MGQWGSVMLVIVNSIVVLERGGMNQKFTENIMMKDYEPGLHHEIDLVNDSLKFVGSK